MQGNILTAHVPERRRFLIALDFSECSRYALEWIVHHLALYTHDKIILFATFNPTEALNPSEIPLSMRLNYDSNEVEVRLKKQLMDLWKFMCNKFKWAQDVNVEYCVEVGDPKMCIVNFANQPSNHITMVVMGSHGKTGTARELGSVSLTCLRLCKCPVTVVKEPQSSHQQ